MLDRAFVSGWECKEWEDFMSLVASLKRWNKVTSAVDLWSFCKKEIQASGPITVPVHTCSVVDGVVRFEPLIKS